MTRTGTWTVPRCHEGRTVAILASGPSMSQAVANAVRDAGVPAIAINTTFRLAPWAWLLYGADATWWKHRAYADAREFAGLKVACEDDAGVPWIGRSGQEGFDPDPRFLRGGKNSGYQALHIAVQTGAARVLLCGYDMTRKVAGHWHDDHPPQLKQTSEEHYQTWLRYFEGVAPVYARMGVDVVNCTPGSAIRCFRMGALEQELANARWLNACRAIAEG